MPEEQVVVETQPTQEQVQADSTAAFERGFDAGRGVSPPVEKPAEAVPATVEGEVKPEPVVEAQPDPWEGVAPKVKAELESVSSRLASVDAIAHDLKSLQGRYGHISKSLDELKAAGKAATTAVADAPTKAQIDQAHSSEKWKQLKEDYPDWADAMDERLAALPSTQAPAVDVEAIAARIRAEVEEETGKKLQGVEERAVEFAVTTIKYPGWKATVKTPEWKAWFAAQPPEVRALEDSSSASDAIKLLDSFTAAQQAAKKAADAAAKKKAEQEANDKRLKGALTPQGSVSASPHTLDDADAFERGYAKARG